jgi:hypothetical protein
MEDDSVRLTGEMDDIFVNAFNLNNMVNMTQMTLSSFVKSDGSLDEL